MVKVLSWNLAAVFLIASCQTATYDPPKTVQESLESFDLIDGFDIENFGHEPHVVDPVDLQFDQSGRIYVVEMPDYPFKPGPGDGNGRIKELLDLDKDGIIDTSRIFTQGISEATSILPWRDGLLVAAAPNITLIRDTDRDGTADSTEVIFTGFFENNSEAQITNLTFGIDNWIYASNHGQSGVIKYLRDSTAEPLNIQGGDFRFRLDRDEFELEAGPAQFGQAFNDRGHRFITQNSIHLRHIAIPWRYTHRHPYLSSTQVAHNISDHEAEMFQNTPPPYWRAERTRRRQEKYDEQGLDRKEYAEDFFTGCSGGTFYGGNIFPDEFYGNIFTGEVAGNLIHRDVLKSDAEGISYVASRSHIEKDREFLFSTDSWFRPAHFNVGPDGCLYVVDYYRQHIETPLSIPEDLKEQMDFLRGDDMGRLYRIHPTGWNAESIVPDLAKATTQELVSILKHPNRWQRLTAQRLILERQDKSIVEQLKHLLADPDLQQPALHALYALESLAAVDREIVVQALTAPYAAVREHALILAERWDDGDALMLPLLADPDGRVAFQAILSLGQFKTERAQRALTKVLVDRGQNSWVRMAVLSAPVAIELELTTGLFTTYEIGQDPSEKEILILSDLAKMVGHLNRSANTEALLSSLILHSDMESSAVQRILDAFALGIKKSKEKVVVDFDLQKLSDHPRYMMVWEMLQQIILEAEG